jgi:hypothetical protein
MTLRRPLDQIAGCCWLPRFADKGRAYLAGELPFVYRLAFGHRLGVDGCFLRRFGVSRRQFLQAVADSSGDEALAEWFLALPSVNPASIETWNRFAPTLGAKGCPGYLTRHLLKWALYPRSVMRPVQSLFEAIEQDEHR